MHRSAAAAALALLAASPAAAQTEPSYVFTPSPLFELPRFTGAGFGSALATPAAQAVTGNPAALPAARALGLHLRASRPVPGLAFTPTDENGAPDPEGFYAETYNVVGTALPVEAGLVLARGPLRLGLGYGRVREGTRREDGRFFGTEVRRRAHEREQHAGAALALALPLGAARLTPGVRVTWGQAHGWERLETTDAARATPLVDVQQQTLTGVGLAVGAVLDGPTLPVRLGVSYQPRGVFTGRSDFCYEVLCTPGDRTLRAPARLEASAGATLGPVSAELTLVHAAWSRVVDDPLAPYEDTVDGHASVRVEARPGLAVALGVAQVDRIPYEEDLVATTWRVHPTRLVLLGLTYERGPLVLDAAYVNGALLSASSSRHHLGQVGLGYRF